jgi:hypothetical protein
MNKETSWKDKLKLEGNYYMQYDPRSYNVLTYEIPVYLIKEADNGKKEYHWMFLFESPYLAKEFYDYVRELLTLGMSIGERDQLIEAYDGHFAMYDRYGKLTWR